MLHTGWNRRALCKRIACEALDTRANWNVIEHVTLRV